MYEISEAFHKQYADMYDKFVRIYLKDGSMRIGLFNDEFYEDISILVIVFVVGLRETIWRAAGSLGPGAAFHFPFQRVRCEIHSPPSVSSPSSSHGGRSSYSPPP